MLTDDDVEDILIASGHSSKQRKRKLCDLSVRYANSLKKKAEDVLDGWMNNGVPPKSWSTINTKPFVKIFGLNVSSAPSLFIHYNNVDYQPSPCQQVIIN